ncbi:hypothetical protein ACWEQL_00665 [Kitasatospora sp. NPDC004240]
MARALVVGIGDFPDHHTSEDEGADGAPSFNALSAVASAVREVAFALDRAADGSAGPPLLECGKEEFTRWWTALCEDDGRDEPVILHFAGHGVQSGRRRLYLVTAGADGSRLASTCVSFQTLLAAAEEGTRPVLFLLDMCGAGQAVVQQELANLAAGSPQNEEQRVWIIGACGHDAITYGARFTTATAEVLHQLADGDLDISPSLAHVPVGTLAAAIDRHLARTDRALGRPGQSVVHTRPAHGPEAANAPAFFRNPAHTDDPWASLLTALNPRLREFALGSAPGLDPLHFATRAAGNPNAIDVHFSGRRDQLRRIREWIENDHTGLLAVTGGPGSGKSALLGVTACLTHPELAHFGELVANEVEGFDPRPAGAVLAVHARQLTVRQVTDSLRQQLRAVRPSAEEGAADNAAEEDTDPAGLVRELRRAGQVLVILDALDEATDPWAVCKQLLLPLLQEDADGATYGCRVLLGTRPWWDTLAPLKRYLDERPGAVLDLDPATDEDRDALAGDLAAYLRRLLPRRFPQKDIDRIAQRLASYSDSGAFLVAALYADHLRTTAPEAVADPPCSITQVFDLHIRTLAANDPWIEPVLTVLGQAQGNGLPLDLVHAAALAHRPAGPDRPVPQLADTRRVLAKAAFYLRTTPDTDHSLLYRYFHQALADRTGPDADAAVLHETLIGAVDRGDWAHARPYLLRHAAAHAVAAGGQAIDRLLEQPGFLVHAEPDSLAAHLHHATTETAAQHARIHRTSISHHPQRSLVAIRRDLLALDAATWQQYELARVIAVTPLDGAPSFASPVASTGHRADPTRLHTLAGHQEQVVTIATLVSADRGPIAVTGDNGGTVMIWDLTSGRRLHTLTDHTRRVDQIATNYLSDGTPVAVTGSWDGTAMVWNLATGRKLRTLADRGAPLGAITVIRSDDTLLAIVAAGILLTVWDLESGEQLRTLIGHTSPVKTITSARLADGTAVVVTIDNRAVITWNPATGQRLQQRAGTLMTLRAPSGLLPDGTPFTFLRAYEQPAGTEERRYATVVWNPVTGKRIRTLVGHSSVARVAGHSHLSDRTPILVTISLDNTAIVWNLATGEQLHTLHGYDGQPRDIATIARSDGSPLGVISNGRVVTVWALATGAELRLLDGRTRHLTALATASLSDSRPLALTANHDGNVIVWDLQAILEAHQTRAVGEGAIPVPGTPFAVAVHGNAVDVLEHPGGQTRHTFTGHRPPMADCAVHGDAAPRRIDFERGQILSIATTALPDGTPIAVTTDDGKGLIWELATGRTLRTLTTPSVVPRGPVAALRMPDGTPWAIIGCRETKSREHKLPPDRNMAATWNLATGEQHDIHWHVSGVEDTATLLLPDGTPLALTAGYDGEVRVWHMTEGRGLLTFTGHHGPVNAVDTVVLPDGTPAALSTGADRRLLIWDLRSGETIGRMELPEVGEKVRVTEDGFMLRYGAESVRFVWNAGFFAAGRPVGQGPR